MSRSAFTAVSRSIRNKCHHVAYYNDALRKRLRDGNAWMEDEKRSDARGCRLIFRARYNTRYIRKRAIILKELKAQATMRVSIPSLSLSRVAKALTSAEAGLDAEQCRPSLMTAFLPVRTCAPLFPLSSSAIHQRSFREPRQNARNEHLPRESLP